MIINSSSWSVDFVITRMILALIALLFVLLPLLINKTELISLNSFLEKSCDALYKSGKRTTGVYTIDPDGKGAFRVRCDMTSSPGRGWTMFQRRIDGSEDFYRGWADYKNGFGNLTGEFWLGLDKIHRLV